MTRRTIFTGLNVRVEKRKRVPATTGVGFTHIADGEEDVTYEVTLDLDAVRWMAIKAARSRGQRSTDGPLSVRVTARRPLP